MSKFTRPDHFKSWYEFYWYMVDSLRKKSIEYNDETELEWSLATYEFGPRINFNALDPGIKIRDIKALAFDEIMESMPVDRQALFDEVHGFKPPAENSAIRWLDGLMRDKARAVHT